MYTVFNTPLIISKCPEGMTEKECPLRKFIKSGQDTFHMTTNESYLVPNEYVLGKIVETATKMHNICHKCNEKTR